MPQMLWSNSVCFFVSLQVSIVWPDKHTSVFEPEWLKKRCFSPAAREALQEELFYNGEYSSRPSPLLCKESCPFVPP